MNYALGLSTGLCLGTSIYLAAFSTLRRRKQAALEQLLQRGTYRILQADGSSVTAGELFQALEDVAGLKNGQRTRGKVIALITFFVTAVTAAVTTIIVLR
ncbi:MAG: hypothetical protein RL033_4457 [Pseudomonadota bacterium]|jgi:hypothetical protein